MKSLDDIIFHFLYSNPIRGKGVMRWEFDIDEVSDELDDLVKRQLE